MIKKDAQRKCLQCGVHITGRSDKRFCSDLCRTAYSNARKKADENEKFFNFVNKVLRRNRNILQQYNHHGNTTVSIELLELSGFDFRYFTRQYHTKNEITYYLCYDFGYSFLNEDEVDIIKHQPHLDTKIH